MAIGTGRLLARTLRDVTSVRGEDLRSEIFVPSILPTPELTPVSEIVPAVNQAICIASGKGGTGKTVVTTNLAIAMAQEGMRITLFDADMGLANAHMLMGVAPELDISSVLEGKVSLADIVVDCPANVKLVCGGSGFSDLAELPTAKFEYLSSEISLLERESDIILIDAAAGIGPQVMRFLKASHDVIVVTTPDATALLDAYALIKSYARLGGLGNIKIIVNRARNRVEAMEAFKKIFAVATKHLGCREISFFGWILAHWYVQDSVRQRYPVVLSHPRSAIAAMFRQLALRLIASHREWLRRKEIVPTQAFSVVLGQLARGR